MVKITKIYTRTGDDGTTGLVGGSRTLKDSVRVCAYGELDELNSYLGLARTLSEEEKIPVLSNKIANIQNEIFDIGALLATPHGEKSTLPEISDKQVARLEKWIDELIKDLPELKSFVLPGGNILNSYLHIARTVCRRAERQIVSLSHQEKVESNLIKYVNRLSDLLFAMSRYALKHSNLPEYLWVPAKDVAE